MKIQQSCYQDLEFNFISRQSSFKLQVIQGCLQLTHSSGFLFLDKSSRPFLFEPRFHFLQKRNSDLFNVYRLECFIQINLFIYVIVHSLHHKQLVISLNFIRWFIEVQKAFWTTEILSFFLPVAKILLKIAEN